MKKSRYNIFIEDENKVLSYNSFNNSYLIISKKAFEEFKRFDDPRELYENYPQTYNSLVSNGYIINDEVDELALLRLENKKEIVNPHYYSLMVYPTQDCNLKCWYCYEHHIPNSKMSQEVLDRVILHIRKICMDRVYSFVRIVFFGGEPFLHYKEIVKPILEELKTNQKQYGVDYIAFFVTNASLLTDEIISELSEYNVLFQITLDGEECVHNQIRKRKKGSEGTYHQIISTIKKIDNRIPLSPTCHTNTLINIRINYDDRTLQGIHEILKDLSEVNRDKVVIHLERIWQTLSDKRPESKISLLKCISEITNAGFVYSIGTFGYKRVSCPAEICNYAVINWDGLIYKCNGRTLYPENAVGYLEADGNIVWNLNRIAKRSGLATFENEMCLKCKMLPQCMGPCSQKLMENSADLNSICAMRLMDISITEYIKLNFELLLARNRKVR